MWAALALLLASVLSAWAYLRILRTLILLPETPRSPVQTAPPGLAVVLAVVAIALLGLGLWPDCATLLDGMLRR